MAPQLPGRELENDPGDNFCFICGPRNHAGMQLRYFDDGEVVRAALPARPEFAGWQGSWNAGLVVAALADLSGWAAWERLAGPAFPAGPITLEALGPMLLDVPATIEARAELDGGEALLTAECIQGGKVTLATAAPMRPLTPEQARQFLQQGRQLPRSLRFAFEGRARASRPAVTSSTQ